MAGRLFTNLKIEKGRAEVHLSLIDSSFEIRWFLLILLAFFFFFFWGGGGVWFVLFCFFKRVVDSVVVVMLLFFFPVGCSNMTNYNAYKVETVDAFYWL